MCMFWIGISFFLSHHVVCLSDSRVLIRVFCWTTSFFPLLKALKQSDWGGDGNERCAIVADRCLCTNYLTGVCLGTPRFTKAKSHNHCTECEGYGVCLGDYRYTHCGKCGQHAWRGNCECSARLLGDFDLQRTLSASMSRASTPRAGASSTSSASGSRAGTPRGASSTTTAHAHGHAHGHRVAGRTTVTVAAAANSRNMTAASVSRTNSATFARTHKQQVASSSFPDFGKLG